MFHPQLFVPLFIECLEESHLEIGHLLLFKAQSTLLTQALLINSSEIVKNLNHSLCSYFTSFYIISNSFVSISELLLSSLHHWWCYHLKCWIITKFYFFQDLIKYHFILRFAPPQKMVDLLATWKWLAEIKIIHRDELVSSTLVKSKGHATLLMFIELIRHFLISDNFLIMFNHSLCNSLTIRTRYLNLV